MTALHLNQDKDLTDLTIAGPDGVAATRHHPFWDETRHAWVDAAQLHPGDHLHALNGAVETVLGVRSFTGSHPMYNLTIDATHTYYVIAGDVPVLVPNTPGCGPQGVADVWHPGT